LSKEELHGIVDVDEIEPKSVHIVEEWGELAEVSAKPGKLKKYKVVYSLPIAVSPTWQAMFQKPDPTRSGMVHQVSCKFSDDGREVEATVKGEPSPELLLVMKSYANRANSRWEPYKEKVLNNTAEEEIILKALKEAT
jgi:hypothetical protein